MHGQAPRPGFLNPVNAAGAGIVLACLAVAWSCAAAAAAPPDAGEGAAEAGIHIEQAGTALVDDVHYLDADMEVTLSRPIVEALERGIPVQFVLDIAVVRERPYLWDETVATLEQRYELDFHTLTRSYIVRNLNIGTQLAFPSRHAALEHLGHVAELPVIDANLLEEDGSYTGRMRARVDINALPVPLRVRALVSPEWRLNSGWHEWRL